MREIVLTDFLQRFHFISSPVRGEICRLESTFEEVLARHDYPAPVRELLGQTMAGVALMAAMLKLEGSLILQVQGDGPVSLLMAESNERGEIRAIARYDEEADLAAASWTALTGQGQLLLTIDPHDGQRYQGVVPLEGDTLAAALSNYFLQSEQLPTQFWLFSEGEAAAGLMLQVLPGHDDDSDDEDIWARSVNLANTLRSSDMLDLPAEEVLYRLYHEEEVELFPARALCFKCSCTRERSASALRTIEPDELREIAAEQGGYIDVDCQFCRQRYRFDLIDIEQLGHPGPSAPDSLQ